MADVDPLPALRAVLLADADVLALVDATGRRIYNGGIPEEAEPAMPQACVVLNPAGGPPDASTQHHGRFRVDTHCYGATRAEAWALHLAVRPVLKQLDRQTVNGVLLHSVTITSGGALGTRPDTHWPVCYATYMVRAADVAAA